MCPTMWHVRAPKKDRSMGIIIPNAEYYIFVSRVGVRKQFGQTNHMQNTTTTLYDLIIRKLGYLKLCCFSNMSKRIFIC